MFASDSDVFLQQEETDLTIFSSRYFPHYAVKVQMTQNYCVNS